MLEQGEAVKPIAPEKKKVSSNDTIARMISCINTDDKDSFYEVVKNYAETLAKGGGAYYRLKRLISERPQQVKRLIELKNLPLDIKQMISTSATPQDSVFLNDDIQGIIDELLIEWSHTEMYRQHNLPIRNKLLLYGVTGNGKTTIARHIACLANIPFVSVFSEGVLDSKLGHSGQNIAKILTQITQPCVLFWDEIDNIAQKRGGGESSSALENDRIVNSFLVNMDKLSNDVIFIAATNRRNVLDTAFLRRFDVQFELVAPTIEEKERFAKQLIAYYNLPEMYLQEPYEQCSSYSEVKMMFVDLARKFIVSYIKNSQV